MDNESSIEDAPFVFNFAVKRRSNLPPKLNMIPDFVLCKGKTFAYQVIADDPDGDDISYYSDNPLVDIAPSIGMLSFIPVAVGDYDTLICASDLAANEDCANIRFIVKEE